MNRRLRLFWGLLLLLSLVWMAAGAFITSDQFEGELGDTVTAEIRSFGEARQIDALATLPPPLLFIASGLPLAVIALFFLWRGRKRLGDPAKDPDKRMRRQALLVSLLSLLFALFLWNIPQISRGSSALPGFDLLLSSLSQVLWPVRLFVTFVHEAGHSLAALLTGGQIQSFTVSPDGSGLATTAGGNAALILPAGYLGAALFGSLLFFLTNRLPKSTRGLSVLLGLAIIILTMLYARPDASGAITAQVVGIGFGVAMVALGWLAPRMINVFILNTLAILTGLNAVMDLSMLVGNSEAGVGGIMNDAAAFSSQITPLLPPSVVALLWSAIAVVMLGAAVYFGMVKPASGEISKAVKGED